MAGKIIAANWKMNGSIDSNKELISGLMDAIKISLNDIIIFPPAIYMSQVKELLNGTKVKLGAQNVSVELKGALTGETSVLMVEDFGCSYGLVGHSERRHLFHETDEDVAKKTALLLSKGITPIVCVGETKAQRESGNWQAVVSHQIDSVINEVGQNVFGRCVIAYEPVWAIGTGLSASPHVANEVHEYISCHLMKKDDMIATDLKILYGGSVNSNNVKSYLAQPYINGVLVGGASLEVKDFSEIILS